MVSSTVEVAPETHRSASRWIGVGRASADDPAGPEGHGESAMGSRALRAALAENVSDALRDAGADVAATVSLLDDRPYRILLLLTDGLAGDQQEIVRGAEPILVTSSVGTNVLTLDDEPALDVYLRRNGASPEIADPAAFARFAMTHPLGVSKRSGEEVRFIAGADFVERSLQCVAQVPQGGIAWVMEGDQGSVLAATDGACLDALEQLGDHQPKGVLAFDCDAIHGAPVAGFYSYGEIARTKGTGGFHNQTLVVLAVS
jgi:hypothetical protein